MTASLLPWPRAKFFFPNTNYPLAGGKLFTYQAGTVTPLATYSDSAGTIPNTNPVILDANGEASVYLTTGSSYKINLTDASGVQIAGYPIDNISGSDFSANQLRSDLANTSNTALGVALVGGAGRIVDSIAALKNVLKTSNSRIFVTGYYSAGDGGGGQYWYDSSDTTSTDNGGSIIVAADGGRWKLIYYGVLTCRQFGAKGDGTTNDTSPCQAAINYCASAIKSIELNWEGLTYLVDNLTIPDTTSVWDYGSPVPTWVGNWAVIKKNNSADNTYLVAPSRWISNTAFSQGAFRISGFIFDGNNIAQDVFVHMNYYSDLFDCVIQKGTRHDLHVTSQTKNLTNIGNTMADNRFGRLRTKLAGNTGFKITDPNNVVTDWQYFDSYSNDNATRNIDFDQAAGAQIIGNHIYNQTAGTESAYIKQAFGARIEGNIFEGGSTAVALLLGGNGSNFVLGPNSYYALLRCDFANAATDTLTLNGGTFDGANAAIYANIDDATKAVFTNGVQFSVSNPYRALNGVASNTRFFSTGDKINSTNLLYSGRQIPNGAFTIADSSMPTFINVDADATLSDDVSSFVRWIHTITAARTLNLPNPALGARRIKIMRDTSATGAFSVLVKYSGSTISTITTAGTWFEVISDGANWVQTGNGSV